MRAHMEWLLIGKALLLGVVEGITEFLPISSTGHLILAGTAIGYHDPTFEIFIQLGAICAIVAMYRSDLWKRARHSLVPSPDRRVVANVLIAFLPAAVVGALLHGPIKQYLFSPQTVAAALIVGGVAIIGVERWMPAGGTHTLDTVRPRQGLSVGLAQILAMWPGFSRAGASILGGMLAGLDRTTATLFSFYLAIPTMLGATVVDLYGARHDLHRGDLAHYSIGFLTAFVVAWLAVKGMLRYISRHNFIAFGIYRIIVGITLTIFITMRLL